MSLPVLSPATTTSAIVLPPTGNYDDVSASLPYGIYATNEHFISGAVEQVSVCYHALGGDVLDVEINPAIVYSSYENAVLEYSYLVNLHQAKNSLNSYLGGTTGSFDDKGQLISGSDLYNSLSGSQVNNKLPRFDIGYARRIGDAMSTEAQVGGTLTRYSASFEVVPDVQDYDLQAIILNTSKTNSDPATGGNVDFNGLVDGKKVTIRRVFWKTPQAMWRFYGLYGGGLNAIGNMSTYGQWSDDTTFEVIPVWYNLLQASIYEENLNVRASNYSYELINNKLRLFPRPTTFWPSHMWVEFTIPQNPWDEDGDATTGMDGINNLNTLPFENIKYENINSIGKQWIRRYALALCKETLGYVRSKFSVVPIPGESVTLNGPELLTQAKEEQEKLREELKTILEDLTYAKLTETEANMVDNAQKIMEKIPLLIFVG